MTERLIPNNNTEAMDMARSVTDNRNSFDVYLDLARKVVSSNIRPELAKLSISERHKQQLIEAESYALAQPAHLQDSANNYPYNLVVMLDTLGVFGQIVKS